MSYIDTFDHEFLGFFARLPVYHPLEVVRGSTPQSDEFDCDPMTLVIGGGGGEHPGLVLKRLDCALAYYVTVWLERHQFVDDRPGAIWCVEWDEFLDEALAVSSDDVFVFAGWNVATYHHFYERCCSGACTSPYDDATDGLFESWLAACLGELIFFSLPELVPAFDQLLPDIRKTITHPIFTNILTPPPGFRIPYGRTSVNGQIQQGYNRWWLGHM